jgi:flagellar hook-associated protein 3 FlgL
MVMRVTQQSIYGNIISQANSSLAKLMATNNQSSTQKRINAPSDDPTGTVQVLNTRTNISQLTQYSTNITEATGWLQQADSTLTSMSTLITTIKEQAEEAATGTETATNRQQIGTAVRQYFQQLISLANTQYSGQSLFAGQKTSTPAYVEALSMNSNDTTFSAAVASGGGFTINGDTDSTVLVQFMASGAGTNQPAFSYSTDGGTSWTNGTYSTASGAGTQMLKMGAVTMSIPSSALNTVKASTSHSDTNGTWMWIRPTAVYQGNTNDTVNVVSAGNTGVTASAAGTFSGNVMVRADSPCSFASGATFAYSYSTDGGTSWVAGNTSGTADGTSVTLSVPGGILTLGDNGSTIAAGNQFFIQPSTADISISISSTDSVVVNNVGKDIFGGIYNGKAVSFSGSNAGNLFETVGKLVGYLDTNNQDGISQCLEDLTGGQDQVLSAAASVGARENRVTAANTMVTTLSENATSTLSSVEDADLTTLMTTLAEQELAYQAVLKSSSTVMNLSLLSYL